MAFKSRGRGNFPPTFEFKKDGDSFDGYLLEQTTQKVEYGKGKKKQDKVVNLYRMQGVDGVKATIWGSGILDSEKVGLMGLPKGSRVRVTFRGRVDVEDCPQPVKQFDVEVDEEGIKTIEDLAKEAKEVPAQDSKKK
jgi:hypothetical protein